PGHPGNNLSSQYSSPNIVLAKYSAAGDHMWSEMFLGGGWCYANGMAIDRADNILLTGELMGYIDFGGGTLSAASAMQQDLFVAKFASSGSYVWGKRYGGIMGERGTAIAVDGNGDAIVGGMFNSKTDLGNGQILGTATDDDMFRVKYCGVAGSYLSSQPIFGNYGGGVNAIKCDPQNNLVAT